MPEVNLVLSIPQGLITATSLGIGGLARHSSPGSGKHFKGRKLFVDLTLKDGQPDFEYLDEGGWRNARGDTVNALEAAAEGKRTKTALSNNAFSCTPIAAYKSIHLVKTGGEVMEMEPHGQLHVFKSRDCHEEMSPAQVSEAAGIPVQHHHGTHLYLVMCPIELILLSNLTPIEYAWYATHRPGKVFRQVIFTELHDEQFQFAAQSRFEDARVELETVPGKKTKTIVSDNCMNDVLFNTWLGYGKSTEGGIYAADQTHIDLWSFPSVIPVNWDRAIG
jgi:hypothetical protein